MRARTRRAPGAQLTRALAGRYAAREVEVDRRSDEQEQNDRQRRSGERDDAALGERKAGQPSRRVADKPQHRQLAPLALRIRPQARGQRNQVAGRAEHRDDGEDDRQVAAERQRARDLALARGDRNARFAQVGGDWLDVTDGLRVKAKQRIGLRRWSFAVAGPAERRNGEAVPVVLHRLLQRQPDEGGEAVVPVRLDYAQHHQRQCHRLHPAAAGPLDARQT